ncbi:hypothetical protein [Flavobacterium pedocola]
MKRIAFFLLISILSIGFQKSFANSGPKFSELTVVMKDGSTKEGKIKHPFNLNKKIVLIDANGNEEVIPNIDVKGIVLKTDSGIPLSFDNVTYYKSPRQAKIAKSPRFMMVSMRGPVTLYYDTYQDVTHAMGAGMSYFSTGVTYYGKRMDEPAASVLSSYVNGQVNPNVVFRLCAPRYFADFPELAAKIESKKVTYYEIVSVVLEYNNWKNSQ